jgi:aminopeptidase N
MNKNCAFFSIFLLLICSCSLLRAQPFTYADTLRGSNGPGRSWWDALYYDLHVQFNLADSNISGCNTISLKAIRSGNLLQIDLQQPMQIDHIALTWLSTKKNYKVPKDKIKRNGNAWFVQVPQLTKNSQVKLQIFYHGRPHVARRAPWDGGIIWKKDNKGRPWISVACQGFGASFWYPCKDYQGDEPDAAAMHITIPDSLMAVANGRFKGEKNNADGTKTVNWAVTAPINTYNLVPYIGHYVHWCDTVQGIKGPLSMDYWVLDYNLDKAKTHFADAPALMKAFEYWFGPYPFYEDGYKLVDAPHLGMEHQSAIAYGNQYLKGYMGKDLSGSGWGLKWDFIIVHESGHEWFANNISSKDIADMWIHESFTNYSEALFTEYYYGKTAGDDYAIGLRKIIANDIPIIGQYGVNQEGSGDMYPKGANMLHNIRQVINNDTVFRNMLRALNKTFYHQTVTTAQVEDFIIRYSKLKLKPVFDQYLRQTKIPVLEYELTGQELHYRYTNCISSFAMPLRIGADSLVQNTWITPTINWQSLKWITNNSTDNIVVNRNFYIHTKKAARKSSL